MLRAPLPSEIPHAPSSASDEKFGDDQYWDNRLKRCQDSFTPCDEIRKLCEEMDRLSDNQREKFWKIVRMPITPATAVSGATGFAAVVNAVPRGCACFAAVLSLMYSMWKMIAHLEERSCAAQTMRTSRTKIQALLPFTHERDMLIVRQLLSDFPDIRDRCSDW